MIAASVILYHPEIDPLLKNIRSYLPFVTRLYIVDNTPELRNDNAFKELGADAEKISYIYNDKNLGIAKALNIAVAAALSDGYGWILTMDQDSGFNDTDAQIYFQQFHSIKENDRIAIVAPSQTVFDENKPVVEKATSVITSGNIIRITAWQAVGGFEERLFIDEVDHDFCYKLLLSNYEIIKLNMVRLQHNLGVKKEAGYLGGIKKTSRTIHNEKRVYFMVRNYLFVRKKYGSTFKEEFKIRDRQILNSLKNNLFFSGNFFKNLKSIYKGYKDFKKNNFTATI